MSDDYPDEYLPIFSPLTAAQARDADLRKDIKRIADSLERIAKFIDQMQGIIDTEYQKKLKREKERKKKVKKDG